MLRYTRAVEAWWQRSLPWLSRSHAMTVAGVMVAFGLVWSRSAITGGVALAVLCAVVHPDWRVWIRRLKEPVYLLPLAFFVLAYASLLMSSDTETAYLKIVTRIPVPLFVVGFAATGELSARHRQWIEATFVAAVAFMMLWLLSRVASHITDYADALSRGKSVPLPNGVLPLSFGMLNAFAALMTLQWYRRASARPYRYSAGMLAVLLVGGLHILANRTGLLCFYGGLLAWLLPQKPPVKHPGWWLVRGVGAVSILALAIGFVPTLQAKVVHGWADWQNYWAGGDLNDWSIGRRLAAWDATLRVWLQNPILGTGLGDVGHAVYDMYDQLGYRLLPENRIGPHNQLLEQIAAEGILGGGVLLAWLSLPFLSTRFRKNPLSLPVIICSGLAMLTDSTLEAQIGLNFFGFFSLLYLTNTEKSYTIKKIPLTTIK